MLTAAQALDQLRNMVSASVEPSLNDTELAMLLGRAVMPDIDGRDPDDDNWVPTYSAVMLNASAAEGWRWKAGRLTAAKSGSHGDASFSPEAQRRDMLAMADDYRKRVIGSQRMYPFERLRDLDRVSGVVLN